MRIHVHRWVEQRRSFAPPSGRAFEADHMPLSFAQRVVFGVTTIEDRCSRCGEIRTTEVVGDARSDA